MNFVAFDLETTGFMAGVDHIVEIAAVRFSNGQPMEAFATLINPNRPIPPEASKVSGITDEMVVGKPTIDQVMEPFAEFCRDDLMVAHNAPFDFQFVTYDVNRLECLAPKGLVLDTCAIARKVFPGLINYKLGTLVQHLKLPTGVFHRAQEDATYCGQLFSETLKKLTQNGQPPAIETLLNLQGGKPLKFPVIERQPKQLDLMMDI